MIAKEIFDKILSFLALVILLPIFLIVTILIKIDSKGSVFFLQERVGKGGKIFKAIKFRTMFVNAPEKTKGVYINKDNPYVTRFGRFLRRSGIDELPQLINVLKGEMSLVGPRPTLKYQADKYDGFQKKRLLMKPGITVSPDDPVELAKAIVKLYEMPEEERKIMGENGRRYVEKYHAIPVLIDRLERVINEVIDEESKVKTYH